MKTAFHRLALLALVAGTGTLLAWAALDQRTLLEEKRQLAETAQRLGVLDVQVLDDLVRADDPDRARTRLARVLVGSESSGRIEGLTLEVRTERLREASRLARETLARRPASWEAAMLAGAAQYLEWSIQQDDRLLTEYLSWEKPLELARQLAPDKQEPIRFLAAAYLELWPALSERKRQITRELLAAAFEDIPTFARLIEPWLAVSGDGDEALELIPDKAEAWNRLEAVYRRRGDLAARCRARDRRRAALASDLERLLDEGDSYLQRGNLLMARSRFLLAVVLAPPRVGYAPIVDRAMASTPAGPPDPARSPRLGAWLDWCLDLATRGGCPLAAATRDALLHHLPEPLPNQPAAAARAARVALAMGDLVAAERIERRTEAPWSADWEIYRVEKANSLIERGEIDDARRQLAEVTGPWADRITTWQAHLRLAEATADRYAEAQAKASIERLSHDLWNANIWSPSGGSLRAEIATSRNASVIEIDLNGPKGLVSALEIRFDGRAIGCFAPAADGRAQIAIDVTTGQHLLEVEPIAGPAPKPGLLALLPRPATVE